MKVLLVNNQYRSVPGGAEAVLLRTEELLRGQGHETIQFSLRHPDTLANRWMEDFPHADRLARSPWRRTDSLATLYSLSVRRRLERLIDRARPHVAHLHNVYEKLTLSVVDALRSRGVPIVLTLHDYRAVCPNGYLLAPDGPCMRCVRDRSTRHAVAHRCLGPSLGANLVAAAECALNRRLRQYDKVDLFLAPSRFLQDAMTMGGLPARRIRLVRNPLPSWRPAHRRLPGAPRFVYSGRLVSQKGLDVLLDASALLLRGGRVVIYGTGREESRLRGRASSERLPVEFRGHHPRESIMRELQQSTAAVIPSLWYENCPMAVVEAAACGVPSITSHLGSFEEMITDHRDGLLVAPGDPPALAAAMDELARSPRLVGEMGRAARRRAEKEHSPDTYLRKVLEAYRHAMAHGMAHEMAHGMDG